MSGDVRAGTIWDQSGWPTYYLTHRTTTNEIYPSEWFFLEKLLREDIAILDIGCAAGGLASVVSEHVSRFEYTGVDVSAQMIARARERHPEHRFHLVEEADLSPVGAARFDLVVCLGVLHLTVLWRELVQAAWERVRGTLLIDLRESARPTLEDATTSYFRVGALLDEPTNTVLPYNVINTSDALSTVATSCPAHGRFQKYGYLGKPTPAAVTPIDTVLMATYRIDRE